MNKKENCIAKSLKIYAFISLIVLVFYKLLTHSIHPNVTNSINNFLLPVIVFLVVLGLSELVVIISDYCNRKQRKIIHSKILLKLKNKSILVFIKFKTIFLIGYKCINIKYVILIPLITYFICYFCLPSFINSAVLPHFSLENNIQETLQYDLIENSLYYFIVLMGTFLFSTFAIKHDFLTSIIQVPIGLMIICLSLINLVYWFGLKYQYPLSNLLGTVDGWLGFLGGVIGGLIGMIGIILTINRSETNRKADFQLANIPVLEILDDKVDFKFYTPLNNFPYTQNFPYETFTTPYSNKEYFKVLKIDFTINNITNILIEDLSIVVKNTKAYNEIADSKKFITDIINQNKVTKPKLNNIQLVEYFTKFKILLDNNFDNLFYSHLNNIRTIFPSSQRKVTLIAGIELKKNKPYNIMDYILAVPPNFLIELKYKNIHSNIIRTTSYNYLVQYNMNERETNNNKISYYLVLESIKYE